jgi:hypothetical protein
MSISVWVRVHTTSQSIYMATLHVHGWLVSEVTHLYKNMMSLWKDGIIGFSFQKFKRWALALSTEWWSQSSTIYIKFIQIWRYPFKSWQFHPFFITFGNFSGDLIREKHGNIHTTHFLNHKLVIDHHIKKWWVIYSLATNLRSYKQ